MSPPPRPTDLAVHPSPVPEPPKRPGFPIVGIGASAGGLDAFKRFFDAMPADGGMAFVLVQHLDPKHESLTAELLTKHTAMKVVQVKERMPVQPNQVYVISPNTDLNLREGVLYLTEPSERRGMRFPIDFFLRSLAEDQQEKAVGIILSGSGSDGTLGLKAIKGYGGVTLVQSPETAQFDGMPHSAVNAGLADYVLPVEQMAQVLLKYLEVVPPLEKITDQLAEILALVQTRTKYDFRFYKSGTLTRRIERRMGLNHISDVNDYRQYLSKTPIEMGLLLKDLLIGVTSFFRDPEVFQLLGKEVIPRLVADKSDSETIRVWVPGCATGEEPYSLAMMLLEQMSKAQKHCNLQIFGTDLDVESLAKARTGCYPETIAADISPERLRQFFRKEGDAYQVSKQVRETVVFAPHNLIGDPPYSRLDLISCRNLLIYVEPELQKKIISLFHFVLNEGGYLFLGKSETIGQLDNLFAPVSKNSRIYRRIGPTRRDLVEFPMGFRGEWGKAGGVGWGKPAAALASVASAATMEPGNLAKITQNILLDQYAPFSVLINRKHEVLHLNGASGEYLELPQGMPTRNLLAMARESLRTHIRTAIYQAVKLRQPAMSLVRVRGPKPPRSVKITARPLVAPRAAEGLLLVSFEEQLETAPAAGNRKIAGAQVNDEVVRALESELKTTKADLESSIQELESANEKLMSSNEEIMSMNEELQSTNEELQTSKEELQSVNEELTTLNNQLQDKVGELGTTYDDLANLLSSTEIATLFLDLQLRIKRFTPAARKLFNLIHNDLGRPLSDISHRLRNSTVQTDAEAVLEKLAPIEKEVCTDGGEWYLQHVLPYRTEDNKIKGIVVTFKDITTSKKAEQEVRELKDWLQLLLTSTQEVFYGVDLEGRGLFVNRAFLNATGYSSKEVMGKSVHALIHHTRRDGSQYPWQDSFVYSTIKEGASSSSSKAQCWRKDGSSFPASCSSDVLIKDDRITGAVVVFRDSTEAETATHKLDFLANHDPLTGLVNRRMFEQRLDRVIETARNDTEQHALFHHPFAFHLLARAEHVLLALVRVVAARSAPLASSLRLPRFPGRMGHVTLIESLANEGFNHRLTADIQLL